MGNFRKTSGFASAAFGVAALIVDYRFPSAEPWLMGLLVLLFVSLASVSIALFFADQKGSDTPQIHIHLTDQVREAVQAVSPHSLEESAPLPSVVLSPPEPTTAVEVHSASHERIVGSVQVVEQDDVLAGAGQVAPPAIRTISNLYVGQVIVSASRLGDEENALEIAVRAYNGSDDTLRVVRVDGVIKGGIANERDTELGRPTWRPEHCAEPIPPGREFTVVLDQRVSPSVAAEYLAAVENSRVSLDLRGLDILVEVDDAPQLRARLPLWHGVTLTRRDDIFTGRIIMASISATSHAFATVATATLRGARDGKE